MILMSWTSAWAESFVVASSATFNSTEIPVSWLNSWRYSVSVGISPRSRETIIFRPKMAWRTSPYAAAATLLTPRSSSAMSEAGSEGAPISSCPILM